MTLVNYEWTLLNPALRGNYAMIRSEMRRSLIDVMRAYEELGMMEEGRRGGAEAEVICRIAESVLERNPKGASLEERLQRFKTTRHLKLNMKLQSIGDWHCDCSLTSTSVLNQGWSSNMVTYCLGGKDRMGTFRGWAEGALYR